MADGCHIENRFGYISTIYRPINAPVLSIDYVRVTNCFYDYDYDYKFGKKKHNHVQTQVTWTKYQISKIQDGGRPPFKKNVFRYISDENHPISTKFGVQMQILVPITATSQNIKIL